MEPQQPQRLPQLNANMAFAPGTLVEATDGLLGRIDETNVYAKTGQEQYVAVRTQDDNQRIILPVTALTPTSQADRLRVQLTRQQAREHSVNLNLDAQQQTFNNDQELRIPLTEERLRVEKRGIDAGVIRINKTVEEVQENIVVPIVRDDVEVQRVPLNQQLDAPAKSRQEGEWLIVPVMREVLVVEKRLMLVEEVRIRRTQITEQKEVRDTVRQERLTIEESRQPNQTNSNTVVTPAFNNNQPTANS